MVDVPEDFDDTDMTNEEFERGMVEGVPVDIVASRAEFERRLAATPLATFVETSLNGAGGAGRVLEVPVSAPVAHLGEPAMASSPAA